jgi:hypothetical protein
VEPEQNRNSFLNDDMVKPNDKEAIQQISDPTETALPHKPLEPNESA